MEIVIEQEGKDDEILEVIEVIRAKYQKAYLGGYRKAKTGTEYHHGIA